MKTVLRGELVLALAGTLLGILISGLLGSGRERIAPTWLLFIALVLLIGVTTLLVARVDEIKQLVVSPPNGDGDTFRKISTDEVSEIAAHMVRNVATMRILGTARQDIIDTNPTARAYLRASEARVRKNASQLVYRRITATGLRPPLVSHLKRMLEAGSTGKHDIQVALVPSIEVTLSYQIFDRDHVLALLEYPRIPGRRDYAVSLISSDQEVIDAFIAHFDNAWSQRDAIKDAQDFEQRVTLV